MIFHSFLDISCPFLKLLFKMDGHGHWAWTLDMDISGQGNSRFFL